MKKEEIQEYRKIKSRAIGDQDYVSEEKLARNKSSYGWAFISKNKLLSVIHLGDGWWVPKKEKRVKYSTTFWHSIVGLENPSRAPESWKKRNEAPLIVHVLLVSP